MKVTGSHLFTQAIKAEGIDRVFTLAGTTSSRCWT